MSEDEVEPPNGEPGVRRPGDAPPTPPYDPDYELIGFLEEREREVSDPRRC
jgi:hypothetical protein